MSDSDLTLWSVTSILGVLDKPALVYWAANETAHAAVRAAQSLPQRIAEDGPAETAKWLAGARYRTTPGARSATELGTAIHAACEQYALTGQRPDVDDEVQPFLDRFDEWAQRAQPEYVAAEMTVYHPEYGYAGTLDAIIKLDGETYIGDYKSTRKDVDSQGKPTEPYAEQVGLQLAGYRFARMAAAWKPRTVEKFRRRYYLLNAAEQQLAQPMPEVAGGLVIHITPERCGAYPIRCGENEWTYFLNCVEVARWIHEDSKTAMGRPLVFEQVSA